MIIHIAQLNIGRFRYSTSDPRMADFMMNLDRINALAERTDGFVWRLKDDSNNATAIRPTSDPNMAVTCAREAVADKVTALVGGLTLYDNAVFPIIAAAGIPWIGLNPLGSLGYTSPDSYATGASAFTYTAAAYYAGKDCSTVAAVRTEGATDSALLNNFAIPGMADAGKKFATVVTSAIEKTSSVASLPPIMGVISICEYGVP